MVLISVRRHLSQVRKDFHWFGSKGSPRHSVNHIPCPPPCNPPTTPGWPRLASPGSGFEITRRLWQSTFLSGRCVMTDLQRLILISRMHLVDGWSVPNWVGASVFKISTECLQSFWADEKGWSTIYRCIKAEWAGGSDSRDCKSFPSLFIGVLH